MPVDVIGEYPTVSRLRTGLFSLDYALANGGNFGLPSRTIIELYGHNNTGKSTLAYYLSAKVSQTGMVSICDLEQLDRSYIAEAFNHAGFDGKVWVIESTIPKTETIKLTRLGERKSIDVGTARYHEEMLLDLAKILYDENTGACILDSIGAIQPLAEMNGDFGEAFMGKRAKLVAQLCRSLTNSLKNKVRPSNAFIINHVFVLMGGKSQGKTTAGGETLKNLAGERIFIWPKETFKLKEAEDNSPVLGFQVEGKVEKLRFGARGRGFQFFIVPGYGVHEGASAMLDCIDMGLADAGTHVKIDGKSLGFLRKDLLAYAAKGKSLKFEPFQELLVAHEKDMLREIGNEHERDSEQGQDDSDVSPASEDTGGAETLPERTKKSRRKSGG